MKRLIWNSVNIFTNKTVLFLIAALIPHSVYALDYPEPGDFAQGSKAWSENCVRCHNMRNPSDLRDDQWVTSVFHMRVRAGLTGQETRDILTFLQHSNARVKPIDSGKIEPVAYKSGNFSGKDVYENNCLACHGKTGRGSLPGMPDFTDKKGRLSKDDSELLRNIINGIQSEGSSMPMPPKGGNSQLSNADLNAALGYIRASFSR